MEELVALCKRRGFIFQSSEIYGGLQGTYDFGPLGVELKNNIKNAWWEAMVYENDDIEGLDSSILTNPLVLGYSGHEDTFSDPMVDCKSCGLRFRADQVPKECKPEDLTEPLNVTIDIVEHLRSNGEAIIIDARDEADFNNGRILGSINIPYDYYEDYEYQLDEVDLEKILIIYCSGGECSLSIDLADYLMQDKGFFNVLIYEGGWPEWKDSGNPIE